MDPETSQTGPVLPPTGKKTWTPRLIGAGVMLLCLILLACLFSYNPGEMGWGFLNSHNAESASKAPCTNIFGVVGLYLAGLLYYFVGAAAPYAVVLCSIIACGLIIKPEDKRVDQWINFGIMLLSATAFLAVQNFAGAEWADTHSLRSLGGLVGYLFGTCILEALIGAVYAAIIFILIHAVALIYFSRLTPAKVARGFAKDMRSLWQLWLARRARKRAEKESRAQAWKQFQEQEPAPSTGTNGMTAMQPEGEPRQMPLPINTQAPGQPAYQPQHSPAPQAPVPPRQRPPLVIPPRPEPEPEPQAKPQRPPLVIPPRPEPEPEPQAKPQRPPLVIPPRPEPEQDTQHKSLRPLPASPHTEYELEPRPINHRPIGIPGRRSATFNNESNGGKNLLDLMEGIEDEMEISSYTDEGPRTAVVPRGEIRLNPEFQAQANRHMGIKEQPAAPATPAKEAAPAAHRYEPVPKPLHAPEPPAPEPEDDHDGLYSDYPFPPYDLLNYTPPSPEVARAAEQEAYEVQQCLIDTFSNFNIAVEPGDITRGPSLTRYEFYPPKGLRLSRISNLGSDLMLATQTKSVNILAPIPGKNTVGVELENTTKESVYLRELLESPAFHNPKLKIPVALGKNVYGEPVIGDLAAMPHALVAGTTGSGKSVCINSMILSMLYKFRPDELRLVLVDPKVVEMQPYRKLPHLACPVVTNPARVIGALRWAVNEMEHRYSMFSKIGVRNFEDFNNRPEGYVPEPEEDELPQDELPINEAVIEAMMSDIEGSRDVDIPEEEETQGELDFEADSEIPAKLPYIVIIIDELADLMMVVKEDLENYIARLTQKARAAGIHLVAATQTPRSNVVTGLIKANIPCRIALKVASPLDSRIILDTNGAENLLGKGDLLFLPPGGITKLTRAQGAWVSDAEIASIIKFCASHAKQKFDQNVTAEMNNADGSGPSGPGSDGENGRLSGSGGNNDDDELYTRCVNLVVTERKASTSLLQRRFSIGYGRAAKIMDMMEARGVISAPQGASRAREVLVEAPE